MGTRRGTCRTGYHSLDGLCRARYRHMTLRQQARILGRTGTWQLGTVPVDAGGQSPNLAQVAMGDSPRRRWGTVPVDVPPGFLKRLSGTVPTPQGPVRLDMVRNDRTWRIKVETPSAAEFVFGGKAIRLNVGESELSF